MNGIGVTPALRKAYPGFPWENKGSGDSLWHSYLKCCSDLQYANATEHNLILICTILNILAKIPRKHRHICKMKSFCESNFFVHNFVSMNPFNYSIEFYTVELPNVSRNNGRIRDFTQKSLIL